MPQKSFLLGGPQHGARSVSDGRSKPRASWTGRAPATGYASHHAQRAAPSALKGPVLLPKMKLPEVPPTPPEGGSGDPINDALDDLLRQAAASLKHLDGLKKKIPAARAAARERRGDAGDFWKPRCRADLWGEDDLDNFSDLDSNLDSDLDSNRSEDVDVDEDGLWDFLRTACNAEPAGPAYRSPAAGHKAPSPLNRTPPASNRIPAPTRQPSKNARPSAEAPPRHEEPPPERARASGFRFGTYGSGIAGGSSLRPPLPGASGADAQTPEVQISCALRQAQAEGADAVRSTLKRLLLKWHPDKAPQGDSDEDVAARNEATRALRFVLQERKRLGI